MGKLLKPLMSQISYLPEIEGRKVLNIVSAQYSGTCAVIASLTSPSVFASKVMDSDCWLVLLYPGVP